MPSTDSATSQPSEDCASSACQGLHDACWTRRMLFLMRWLPAWLVTAMTYPVTALIWLLAVKQREAVRANLDALMPVKGASAFAGFRVFLNFALTYLDRLWYLHFDREVEWEIIGREEFEQLRKPEAGGALVFTVHSGNYDIGAGLFASKFGRPIHTVRMPEATASLQKLREQELRRQESKEPHLHIHYNEPGGHLGMELCRRLMAGEVVCVQGDRVMGDVAPTEAHIDGVTYMIPRGPLVLAEVTGVPCHPVFLTRKGRLSYRIEIGRPFHPGGRKPKVADVSAAWVNVMHAFLLKHWDQWFVFEPLVTRDSP